MIWGVLLQTSHRHVNNRSVRWQSCYVGWVYEKIPFFPLDVFSRTSVTHTHMLELHMHELMQITLKPKQSSYRSKNLTSAEPPSLLSEFLNSIFSAAQVVFLVIQHVFFLQFISMLFPALWDSHESAKVLLLRLCSNNKFNLFIDRTSESTLK